MKKVFLYILGLALFGAIIVVSAEASFDLIKEAEDYDHLDGAVENEHDGFTGSGYVNFFNQNGNAAEWTVNVPEAGTYGMIFHYANGSRADRDMELHVNGAVISADLSFSSTGAWDNWQAQRISDDQGQALSIDFRAGENTIYATSVTRQGGPNLDRFHVVSDEMPLGDCGRYNTSLSDVIANDSWKFVVPPHTWKIANEELILETADIKTFKQPKAFAILTEGPKFGPFTLKAEVRIDTSTRDVGRDVVIIFGYQSDTKFYYVHLSSDNSVEPHNGIFKVNGDNRERIDKHWPDNPPAVRIHDLAYHDVSIMRCPDTGDIKVYVDDTTTPLMTAKDTTFSSGRVGFGSFDNSGRMRNLTVEGESVP